MAESVASAGVRMRRNEGLAVAVGGESDHWGVIGGLGVKDLTLQVGKPEDGDDGVYACAWVDAFCRRKALRHR